MTIFELFAWMVVIITLVIWLVVALEWCWTRYYTWSIQREREFFWAELERKMRRACERYVVPEGPYR